MRASFVFSEVVTGLRRNVTMTIAMILTTAISLGMFGGGLLFVRTIDKMKANYLEDVEVTVYLNEDVSANDRDCTAPVCSSLQKSLQTNPAVESVVYENQAEAYKRFQKMFQNEPDMQELVKQNSLPASLHVKLFDPQRSQVIVQEYRGTEGVSKINDQNKLLERFLNLLNEGRNGTFIVALIAAAAAVLLIANTIQVSAFTRRTEVGIMRLVGATRWYTQLPFLLEAVVAGALGAVLAIGGLIGLKYALLDSLVGQVAAIPPIELLDIAFPVAPALLGTSIVISAVTGYVTLRLYVRH